MAWYEIAIGIFLIIASVAIIVIVLIQEGNERGLSGAIAGGAAQDTFFDKNKGNSMKGRLKRLTTIVSIAFFIVVLVAFIVLLFI